jgi:hypothetical protein
MELYVVIKAVQQEGLVEEYLAEVIESDPTAYRHGKPDMHTFTARMWRLACQYRVLT